jgi:cytochrome c-type biogenesis protein
MPLSLLTAHGGPLADNGLTTTVSNGPLIVAAGVAALVGLVGFVSPCVLPLVPGYLAYVAGLTGENSEPSRRRMVGGAFLFVLGFTAIFVCQGVLFGQLGASLRDDTVVIERVLGAITIVMGIAFLGGLGILQREFKIHRLPKAGLVGAPLLGATFGLAWAPCLTPTYSVVYSMATSQGTAGRGAFLTAFYCLGLGVPFILVALGFGWVSGTLGFLRRHLRVVSQIGGTLLIVMGVLLVTGEWNHLMNMLRSDVGSSSWFENI